MAVKKRIPPPYRHIILAILVIIFLMSFLVMRPKTKQVQDIQQTKQSSTATLLINNLKQRSLDVDLVGNVSVLYDATQNSSLGAGQRLRVNNEEVQLYEFPTAQAANETVAKIQPDGYTIGLGVIDWVAPPHFFRKDNMIVVYIGTDSATLTTLENELGPQFAGQK